MSEYSIVPAQECHVAALAEIELAAAQLLIGYAPHSVLSEATARTVLVEAAHDGHLWVALSGDTPVGFALVEMLAPDLPHLQEIDVHPAHGRRGIGTALVRAVCAWSTGNGYPQLTLTTFRAVRWNMPFYSRLGFVEIPPDKLPPQLAAVVAQEAARGLLPTARVVMAYRCPATATAP